MDEKCLVSESLATRGLDFTVLKEVLRRRLVGRMHVEFGLEFCFLPDVEAMLLEHLRRQQPVGRLALPDQDPPVLVHGRASVRPEGATSSKRRRIESRCSDKAGPWPAAATSASAVALSASA